MCHPQNSSGIHAQKLAEPIEADIHIIYLPFPSFDLEQNVKIGKNSSYLKLKDNKISCSLIQETPHCCIFTLQLFQLIQWIEQLAQDLHLCLTGKLMPATVEGFCLSYRKLLKAVFCQRQCEDDMSLMRSALIPFKAYVVDGLSSAGSIRSRGKERCTMTISF